MEKDIMKRNPMPNQEPLVRNKNFKEVALGYDAETAIAEAKRCLDCKHKPCMNGCPVNISIPEFISYVAEGEFEKAYEVISRTSALPAVCGRVCPQEKQCEAKCVRGIKGDSVSIGRLERFVADYHNANAEIKKLDIERNGKRVAVIGSGPSSLTCAGDLAKMGYDVTVFEALHIAGGVLIYGIPEFRLPKAIVAKEVEGLKAAGVDFKTNVVVGKSISIDDIFEEYDAVFIGSGAGLPRFMGIEGENLKGVYSANEFLTRINLMKAYSDSSRTPVHHGKKVAVVGGGNVAMDAARSAIRLGAEKVYVIYRRSLEEIPARAEEVEHAIEETIEFRTLTNPVRIVGDADKNVCGIECVKMELGEPDESGRRKPFTVEASEHIIDVDCVIMAIGTSPNPLIKATTAGLDVNARGGIVTDEMGRTSREGVFAGGDAVTGAATVIKAMGAGKASALAIDEYLKNK
ncbi:MAG: NADPH-dependent glutamate synthase [Eubacterium sp.]|nr:NADPH-dependent glutamate synthase [Eubacterium sp.]